MEAFGIDNPWNVLGSIASRCGIGIPDLRSPLVSAFQRRHEAAHKANANVETTDLISFSRDVVAFSLSFDLILSYTLRKLLDADPGYLSGKRRIAGKHIGLRFLQSDGKVWREIIENKTRAYAKNTDFDSLKRDCFVRARKHGQAVVVKGNKGLPIQWFTPDID